MEKILFSMLCQVHLEQGGKVGLGETNWGQNLNDLKGSYSRVVDNVKQATWNGAYNVVTDIVTRTLRLKKSLDDVAFYPRGDGEFATSGATWRILKNYMSFLRIVLKNDKEEMGSILRRLDSIMRDAMYGDSLKKAAENN